MSKNCSFSISQISAFPILEKAAILAFVPIMCFQDWKVSSAKFDMLTVSKSRHKGNLQLYTVIPLLWSTQLTQNVKTWWSDAFMNSNKSAIQQWNLNCVFLMNQQNYNCFVIFLSLRNSLIIIPQFPFHFNEESIWSRPWFVSVTQFPLVIILNYKAGWFKKCKKTSSWPQTIHNPNISGWVGINTEKVYLSFSQEPTCGTELASHLILSRLFISKL